MVSALEKRWLATLAGQDELDLSGGAPPDFDPLIEAMSPPDLRAIPDFGSKVCIDQGRVLVEFEGSLVPVGSSEETGEPAGYVHRILNPAAGWARHIDFGLNREWARARRGRRAICKAALLYLELGI